MGAKDKVRRAVTDQSRFDGFRKGWGSMTQRNTRRRRVGRGLMYEYGGGGAREDATRVVAISGIDGAADALEYEERQESAHEE